MTIDIAALKAMPRAEQLAWADKHAGVAPGTMDGIWRTETGRGTHPTLIGPDTKWGKAKGHFQALDETNAAIEKRLGVKLDRFDFTESLVGATTLVKENRTRYGSDDKAVMAYHGGTDQRNWGPKTEDYLRKVTGRAVGDSPASTGKGATKQQRTAEVPVEDILATSAADVEAGIQAAPAQPHSLGDTFGAFRGSEVDTAGPAARAAGTEVMQAEEKARQAQTFFGDMYGLDDTSTLSAARRKMLTPVYDLISHMMEPSVPADAAYMDGLIKENLAGYDDPERDRIYGTTNAYERAAVENRIAEDRRNNRIVGRASTTGQVASMFIASAYDPTTWIAGIGAAKAFAVAGYGASALASQGRAGAALASSLGENALGNVAWDAAQQAMGEHRSVADYSISAAAGILGMGLTAPGLLKASAVATARRLEQDAISAQAKHLREAADTLGPQATPEEVSALATKLEAEALVERRASLTRPATEADKLDSPDLRDPDSPHLNEEGPDAKAGDKAPAIGDEPGMGGTTGSTLDYEPRPTIGGSLLAKLYENGQVLELRTADDLAKASEFHARFGDAVPDEAKAMYSPQEDKVYIFRDRLTPEDVKNPSGLIAHEVGVHYGLERAVGPELFTKIITDIEASADKAVAAARTRLPADTPLHLRGEELLGYMAEANPNSPAISRLVATVRNWMRENLSMFKDMKVTVNDALQYIRGATKRAAQGQLSQDLTFPYVWHGGPTRDIDKLDTSFVGTGEGHTAFGWGNYVTSERGTALDYRNKESKRRGMKPEEGGLYRVKVLADKAKLLDWDKPVSPELAAKFPDMPTQSGEAFYKGLTESLGTQKAASEALAAADVPGLTYTTGRTRGKETTNQNYVLFSNEATDIAARYSMKVKGAKIAPAKPYVSPKVQALRAERIAKAAAEKAAHLEFDIKYGLDTMPELTPQERAEKKLIRQMRRKAEAWDAANPSDPERLRAIMNNSLFNLSTTGMTMAQSADPLMRMVAGTLVEHTTGASGRRVTAAIRAHTLQTEFVGNAIVQYDQQYALWRNQRAGALAGAKDDLLKGELQEKFRRLVMIEQERRLSGQSLTTDPTVSRAADITTEAFERMRIAQVENKTPGWANLPDTSRGYMPHAVDKGKFLEVIGSDPVRQRAFQQVMARQFREVGDFDAEFADKVAAQYLEHARINALGGHEVPVNVDNPMAAEYVRQSMLAAGMARDEVEAFAKRLSAGSPTHTKKRLQMDLTEVFTDASGQEFMLMDLFQTDPMTLVRSQARKVAGEVALMKTGVAGSAGVELIRKALQRRAPGSTPGAHIDEMKAFDQALSEVTGRPHGEASPAWADLALTANAVANLGGMGITQIAETVTVGVGLGVESMLRTIGTAPKMAAEVRALARGERVTNGILSSMEPPGGGGEFGLEGYKMVMAYDNPTAAYDTYNSSSLGTVSKVVRGASHGLKIVSAHRIINAVQLRSTAQEIVRKTLVRIRDGKDLGSLADMGFTPDVVDAFKAKLDDLVVWGEGGGVKEFDIRKLGNAELAEKFTMAVHRGSKQLIQGTFAGEAGKWQNSVVGRFASQFRNFPLVAMEKQWGRTRANEGTNKAALLLMAAAGAVIPLVYARVALNAAGRPDREEYIEKMTTPYALARATMNYVGGFGLAGDLMDFMTTTASAVSEDAASVFQGGQTRTGRAPTFTGQVPILGYADEVMKAPVGLLQGNPFAAAAPLPFSNTPWLIYPMNLLREDN